MNKKNVALMLAIHMLMHPAMGSAASIPGYYGRVTPPPANQLPQLKQGGTLKGATVAPVVNNTLTINQNQAKATIDWEKFNIGANATVYFKQQKDGVAQKDWAALNRIYDNSPSLIYGNLKADGKVYLINQNGILFGPGSQMNVHTMIASTMNLRDKDFLGDSLRFTAENYQHQDYQPLSETLSEAAYAAAVKANLALPLPAVDAAVSNHGNISTGVGGAVYLMGPQTENAGVISTPSGVSALVAVKPLQRDPNTVTGAEYDLQLNDVRDTDVMTSKQTTVTLASGIQGGEATNFESGSIAADSGLAAMYGGRVAQRGLIRAITAVKKGGRIELLASDRITTGATSVTATPISDSSDTANQTFGKKEGTIILAGLNSGSDAPPLVIDHEGVIEAPSGKVYLEASQRIFLGGASKVDVSGLWVDESAEDLIVTQQLNTINLRDNFAQKNGVLQGETISVNSLFGTSIGDVSGKYGVRELTAREKSTTGGKIFLGANMLSRGTEVNDSTTREVVVSDGAQLGFAGGGFRYAAGFITTTKLVSGNTIYDISSAPEWLAYRKILTGRSYLSAFTEGHDAGLLTIEARQSVLNGRISGAAARGFYQTKSAELTDAYGNQKTQGRKEALGGTLTLGSAGRLNPSSNSRSDAVADKIELVATAAPLPSGFGADSDIAALGLEGKTVVATDTLNNAGLSSISLYANQTFAMAADAGLTLASVSRKQSDGSTTGTNVMVRARSIDFRGSIDAPGGSVTLSGVNNLTSFAKDPDFANDNPDYIAMPERIYFAEGSRISVAGDRVDNFANRGQPPGFGHVTGGKITLNAYSLGSDGLLISKGALLDVGGGYTISDKGKVTGGDAGSLSLAGPNVLLDGDVRGLSLLGNKGGKIAFTSEKILVDRVGLHLPEGFSFDSPLGDLKQGLVLAADALDLTGFSRIELNSFNDAALASGVTLRPSLAVMANPVPGKPAAAAGKIATATPDLVSGSSITLVAGAGRSGSTTTLDVIARFPEKQDLFPGGAAPTNLAAQVTIPADARIETAPGGSITLKGPAVQISGQLVALSGAITASVSTDPSDQFTYNKNPLSGTLLVGPEARLDVSGYNKPLYGTVAGVPAGYSPLDAGAITLSATTTDESNPRSGNVRVMQGAVLDVSGSEPVSMTFRRSDGSPEKVTVASNPGAISITYQKELTLDGELAATGQVTGLRGGTLSISRENQSDGLSLSSSDVRHYLDAGFDALSFRSLKSIDISGGERIATTRSLTLDAPVIAGSGSDEISLSSPWLKLTNSYLPIAAPQEEGSATLNLSGMFIDVEGDVKLAGFQTVTMEAAQDIRLTDLFNSGPNNFNVPQAGRLETAGDLILKANRIYPTSQTRFTIASSGGTITTLPNGTRNDAIYSAFGNLTLTAAEGINHQGYLAAPMGEITLTSANGRVYLDQGSVTTTAATVPVNVGGFDGDLVWSRKNRSYQGDPASPGDTQTNPILVSEAPEKSITLNGDEVLVAPGAVVDLSGGGAIYGYTFISDLTGTVNPISIVGENPRTGASARTERFVILPDNSVQLPGFTYTDANGKQQLAGAVHLAGVKLSDGTVLKEGTYSLLPEQYAFLPGAVIVSSAGTTMAATDHAISKEGYTVVPGYATFLGSSVQPAFSTGFVVRSAREVLKEGHFESKQFMASTGGTLAINGNTSILQGDLRMSGLGGSDGGNFSLTAGNITISPRDGDAFSLADFDFAAANIPDALKNSALLDPAAINDKGIQELSLTASAGPGRGAITIDGSTVTIPNITLQADSSISILNGAELNAVGQNSGALTLVTSAGGSILIDNNALARAFDKMTIDTGKLDLQGDLQVDNGGLSLIGNRMYVVSDSYQQEQDVNNPILYLSSSLLGKFANIRDLSLISRSDLVFRGDSSINVTNLLTIDTARIGGDGLVSLNAAKINLMNSGRLAAQGAAAAPALPVGDASITFNAAETSINVGNSDDTTLKYADRTLPSQWDIYFDGFRTVKFDTANDLTLKGVGALRSGGDVNLTAARVTTAAYSDAATPFKSSRVAIEALNGTVSVNKGTGTAGNSSMPGGSLAISARDIVAAGTVDLRSGRLDLKAANSITLTGAARILATGSRTRTADSDAEVYSYGSGGMVNLAADTVNLQQGSVIDVSAFAFQMQDGTISRIGDAGSIALSGPGGVTLNGTVSALKGSGANDLGGSFALDAATVDIAALAPMLGSSGFDRELLVRARQGDLNVDSALKAGEIYLSTDIGNITVADTGTLDVSGARGGGRIELAAGNDLNLFGKINAAGTGAGASGGEVRLQAGNVDANGNPAGTLSINPGASIDVSGRDGNGNGNAIASGTVHLRAMRSAANDDLQISLGTGKTLKDTVTGVTRISVEGVRIYDPSTTFATMLADAGTFMTDSGSSISNRLFGQSADAYFQLLPGIEVRSSGDLDLATLAGGDLDLTTARFSGMPGVLTLRSGGNLNVNANLVDHPALDALGSQTALRSGNLLPSWGINLVAGADLAAADIMATNGNRSGNFTVGDGVMVYTENAPVSFASAGNTALTLTVNETYRNQYTFLGMPNSLGTFSGDVRGKVGGELTLIGGVIQTATGDIRLDVGGNIKLTTPGSNYGSIRTTGQPALTAQYADMGFTPDIEFFNYQDGGSIWLTAGGNISGAFEAVDAWEYGTVIGDDLKLPLVSRWSANYGAGVGANGTGPDKITQGIATMAGGKVEIRSWGDVTSQVGAFSEVHAGDVRVHAQGDINGRYLVANGNGSLSAHGNAGLSIELLNAREMNVTANGSIVLSSVRNPTLVEKFGAWDPTYARDGKLTLTSLAGSVSLYGTSGASNTLVLPPSLSITAADDISIHVNTILAPSPNGGLRLFAGGSIMGKPTSDQLTLDPTDVPWKQILMSDLSPHLFFKRADSPPNYLAYNSSHGVLNADSTKTLHADDAEQAVIRAGVDLGALQIILAKKADISAGNDIGRVFISTQNQKTGDVTNLSAAGNVIFSMNPDDSMVNNVRSGIEHAGPGTLVVSAGKDLDLGNSAGIRSVGNTYNTALGAKGSDAVVLVGANPDISPDAIRALFLGVENDAGEITTKGLQQYGNEYSDLLAKGDKTAAEEQIATARNALINPLFAESTADGGRISMVSSQISTATGADSIYIVAKDSIDVGISSLNSNVEGKGIVTGRGGGINIYTGKDLNVNTSRVMSFFGGDITIWADTGNINAGRGSKTAVSPPKAVPQYAADNVTIIGYTLVPPAVGSGLRALTYDANTRPDGDIPIPEPGDIFAFAPQGVIDAGEAGIAGGRVVLGATEVINARNISFSAGSVGVPSASDGGVSLGALAGASSLSETSKMAASSSSLGANREKLTQQASLVDQFLSRYLDVKVIDFDKEEGSSDSDNQDEEKRKKK